MLRRIRIDNFKCLVDFDLSFDSINLFIGNNGAGKSTVFDVLRRLQTFILGYSKVSGVFPNYSCTRWQNISTQFFELYIEGNDGKYIYSLWIEHNSQQSYIRQEKIFFDNQPLIDFNMGKVEVFDDSHKSIFNYVFDSSQSILPLLSPSDNNRKLTWFKKRIERFINVKIAPNQMYGLSEQPQTFLSPFMENYSSWYRYISQDQGKIVELMNCLKEILDGFISFKFDSFSENRLVLTLRFVKEQNENNIITYTFDEISDGEKVLIGLYTLLYCTKSEDYTLCIDEPENFLALPEIQPWLVSLFDFCNEGKIQAVLISHHPELINYLASYSGYWFERNGNAPTKVRKILDTDIDETGLPISELVARGWLYEPA